mgnify:CR=1 FL=1|jgi:hypothetical protein
MVKNDKRMYYDMNEQERIDRQMCKPGYTWNSTLGKCLGYGGGSANEGSLPEPGETPTGAIKQESAKRTNGSSGKTTAPR